MMSDCVEKLVEKLISSHEFKKVSYILHSYKDYPHGMVEERNYPSEAMLNAEGIGKFHLALNAAQHVRFPQIFERLNRILYELMNDYGVTRRQLCLFYLRNIWNSQLFYDLLYIFTIPSESTVERYLDEIITAFEESSEIPESVVISEDFIPLFLISLTERHPIKSISEIKGLEQVEEGDLRYALSNVTDFTFCMYGYYNDDKFFPYNLFINRTIDVESHLPLLITLFRGIAGASIWMRCDKTLVLQTTEYLTRRRFDAELYRGRALREITFFNTEHDMIIRYNPVTMNKLLFYKGFNDDNQENVISISLEGLWNPDNVDEISVICPYIHGTYNLEEKRFEHIDFSINEYADLTKYREKYSDNSNGNVKIGMKADEHYKVWCIKFGEITIQYWCKIVSATLDEPFYELFQELIAEL